MTVQQFALKPPLERMAVIDRLWDAIVEWVAPNQTAQQMMDPDAGNPVHNVISARRSRPSHSALDPKQALWSRRARRGPARAGRPD